MEDALEASKSENEEASKKISNFEGKIAELQQPREQGSSLKEDSALKDKITELEGQVTELKNQAEDAREEANMAKEKLAETESELAELKLCLQQNNETAAADVDANVEMQVSEAVLSP